MMFQSYPAGGAYGLHLPYAVPISPSLSNGTQIQVTGTPTGNRFEVNIKGHHDDTILHFNPRFDDNAIVLNNAQRGSWGSEERHGQRLQRGVRFTLNITATDHGFNISVNNGHLCEFRHRSPMYTAQTLEVKGDLSLESAQVFPAPMGSGMGFPQMGTNVPFAHHPPSFPSTAFPNPGFPSTAFPTPGFPSTAFSTPAFPGFPSAPSVVTVHTYPMGGSSVPSIQSIRLHVGSRIFVRGFIPQGASRFELNLLQGYNDTDDIAFHFNPRFDSRTIVKNHRKHGQWGSEENQPFPAYMPLMPGTQIDLQIACHRDRYTVHMNNQPIAEYVHKITPGSVMAVQYKGDINVTSVGQL